MTFKLHYVVILSVSLVFLPAIPTFAKAEKDTNRGDIIEKKLSCFSNNSSKLGVDWDEVCVSSFDGTDARYGEEMDNKSLDQMVKEHDALADEMLSNSVLGEEISNKTVDDVADKINKDEETYRTVDDFIKEQKILENSAENASEGNSSSKSSVKKDFKLAKNEPYTRKEMAQESTDEQKDVSGYSGHAFERDSVKNSNSFELGFEFNRFRYEEPIFDLVDKGNLFGLYAGYTARPAKHESLYEDIINVYKVEGRFNYGTVDYESTGSGTIDDITDWTYEIRLLGGKDFLLAENFRITPLIGFGYRYLNDDTGGMRSSVGHYGYEREANYIYIPIGVEFTARLTDHWTVSPYVEYDIFIQGTQKSHLSDVPGGYPDLSNKQHHGYGVRASVKLIKEMNPFSLVIEPYIRYWDIEDSEVQTVAGSGFIVTGLEPANSSTEYGIRLGAMF